MSCSGIIKPCANARIMEVIEQHPFTDSLSFLPGIIRTKVDPSPI